MSYYDEIWYPNVFEPSETESEVGFMKFSTGGVKAAPKLWAAQPPTWTDGSATLQVRSKAPHPRADEGRPMGAMKLPPTLRGKAGDPPEGQLSLLVCANADLDSRSTASAFSMLMKVDPPPLKSNISFFSVNIAGRVLKTCPRSNFGTRFPTAPLVFFYED